MKQVDIIKAFAELEGVELYSENGLPHWDVKTGEEYNPITDLALNCAARDKYKILIDYTDWNDLQYCSVSRIKTFINDTACTKGCCNESYFDWDTNSYENCDVIVEGIDDVPYAVIECILKSEGKWHE